MAETEGNKAQRYLLIIDVQKAFFEGKELVPQPEWIIKNIKSVLDQARAAKPPIKVIWVRHNELEEPGSDFILNTRLWEIHDSLVPLPSDSIIEKTKPSSFDQTNLSSLLPSPNESTTEFIVTGMQSDCCVAATAQDLLKLYPTAKTVIVKGAHWTLDYETITAKETAAAIDTMLEKKGAMIVGIDDLKL